jgi:hypothetical protein
MNLFLCYISIHMMSNKCISCGGDPIDARIIRCYCDACCRVVHHALKPVLRDIRKCYDNMVVYSYFEVSTSIIIRIHPYRVDLETIIDKICTLMSVSPGSPGRINDYRLTIKIGNIHKEPYSTTTDIWAVNITFDIKYAPLVKSLAQITTKKCAKMGHLDNLTDDAIDLVLAYDHLLAVRFIINND